MTTADGRPRVLFLCTGNSCRSQMAEGWARHLHGASVDACSAGTDPHGLNPRAVAVMAEAGIDISAGTSKRPEACDPSTLDLVVTVCGHARETCPSLPGAPAVIHAGFDDPPRLAADATNDDEALPHYRRVRNEIGTYIEGLPATLRAAGIPLAPGETKP